MLAHQKNNEGNSIIHEYMLRDYSEPKDFASFLYVSQVLQAEASRWVQSICDGTGRASWDRCSGS